MAGWFQKKKCAGSDEPPASTALKYTLLMSSSGIVYREIEHGIIIFVSFKDCWFYSFRYHPKDGIRLLGNFSYQSTLFRDLQEWQIDAESGWLVGERFSDKSILQKVWEMSE